MALLINGTEPDNVKVNGTEAKTVIVNGEVVWEKLPSWTGSSIVNLSGWTNEIITSGQSAYEESTNNYGVVRLGTFTVNADGTFSVDNSNATKDLILNPTGLGNNSVGVSKVIFGTTYYDGLVYDADAGTFTSFDTYSSGNVDVLNIGFYNSSVSNAYVKVMPDGGIAACASYSMSGESVGNTIYLRR